MDQLPQVTDNISVLHSKVTGALASFLSKSQLLPGSSGLLDSKRLKHQSFRKGFTFAGTLSREGSGFRVIVCHPRREQPLCCCLREQAGLRQQSPEMAR